MLPPSGMSPGSRGSMDAGLALLRALACVGEVAVGHDLDLGVVGAQHPHAVGEGLLAQRDGPAPSGAT